MQRNAPKVFLTVVLVFFVVVGVIYFFRDRCKFSTLAEALNQMGGHPECKGTFYVDTERDFVAIIFETIGFKK